MTKRRFNILVFSLLLPSLAAVAQPRHSAKVDEVQQDGFYHITVTPELSCYLKPGLEDLRIIDNNKTNVPFIIISPDGNKNAGLTIDHKIISRKNDGTNTILIIENAGKYSISNLKINLKSGDAQRPASIAGSNDNREWFAVLDSVLLLNPSSNERVSHSQEINFPPSDYAFFKLIIRNGNRSPLNILTIESGRKITDTIQLTNNPPSNINQVNENGYSLVTITSDCAHHFNHLKLMTAGTSLFNRPARLLSHRLAGVAETWNANHHVELSISSDNQTGYTFPLIKADSFYLVIKNGDNPPLKISSITTAAPLLRIVAQLEKGNNYQLTMDDANAFAPQYDLQQFRERINASAELHYGKITAIQGNNQTVRSNKLFQKWWIWPALIFVVSILGLLVVKLTTDMKKEKNIQSSSLHDNL